MISWIINAVTWVICHSLRLRQKAKTRGLIIHDIMRKPEFINCFIIHFFNNMQKKTLFSKFWKHYTDEGLGRDEPISAADTGLSCRVFIVSLMYNNFLCSSIAESLHSCLSVWRMDFFHTIEMALPVLRQLLTFLTSQDGSERENTFVHRARAFIDKAIFILEQMEDRKKKQCSATLNFILSTAWLVVQNLHSGEFFSAVRRVMRDIKDLFNGQIPNYMTSSYEELRRLLDTTSVKLENIRSICCAILEQVRFTITEGDSKFDLLIAHNLYKNRVLVYTIAKWEGACSVEGAS